MAPKTSTFKKSSSSIADDGLIEIDKFLQTVCKSCRFQIDRTRIEHSIRLRMENNYLPIEMDFRFSAGGVRPTRVLRAEAVQKRKRNRGGRATYQSRAKGCTGGPRVGGALRLGGWHPSDPGQPQPRVHVLAGGCLQTATPQLLPSGYARQCESWQNGHCSTVIFNPFPFIVISS